MVKVIKNYGSLAMYELRLYTSIMSETKYTYYETLKTLLTKEGLQINPYREIDYGLQFLVFVGEESGLLRIFESQKKGVRLDFSQLKNTLLMEKIEKSIQSSNTPIELPKTLPDIVTKAKNKAMDPIKDPEDLIGVDESGKGDYFGPLVTAAVHVKPEHIPILKELGIKDSKKLFDKSITELAQGIADTCDHAVIIMGNSSYNEVYDKMKNLNHILAWSHAKVIEDTLAQEHCEHVLCDQFGNEALIEGALQAKGIDVHLYQRPRAESNIAVAAASILARNGFIEAMRNLEHHYNMPFPKGSSNRTIEAGKEFVTRYSKSDLIHVAKLHFKQTNEILKEN